MGLDMYLTAKRYISSYKEEDVEFGKKIQAAVDTKGYRPTYITLDVGYWRKANAIHAWFVKNIQDGKDDCGSYRLSRNKALVLLDFVKQVLSDNSKAENLLPAADGFFFGSTEYNEWYFENLEETKTILEGVIENFMGEDDFTWEVEYQSSW
jgi:hypothetical protein